MLYLRIVLVVSIAIVLYCLFGYSIGQGDAVISFLGVALIFSIVGVVLYSVAVYNFFGGYAVNVTELPINGVCEVIYVSDEEIINIYDSKLPPLRQTLIKLPDNQLRLFQLNQKLELGLIKVLPEYKLVPFKETLKP